MKRTRRTEVMRYRRHVEVFESGETSITETLAIAQTHEVLGDTDNSLPLAPQIPVREPPAGLRSKARQLLRRLKR